MFTTLRRRAAREGLYRWISGHSRQRRVHQLDTAASVYIVLDAGSEKTRRETAEWAEQLRKKGKKVQVLGYVNEAKPPEPAPAFDTFTRKETAWNYAPKSEKALDFTRANPDLLLCINPNDEPAVEWIAVKSGAAMKIGTASAFPNDFDLQIDAPAAKGVPFFIQQVQHYLEKISSQ